MGSELDFREVEAGSALDEFHFDMWGGAMKFLIGQDEVRARFEAETGQRFIMPRSGFEAMIDKACGISPEGYVRDLCRWATPLYWGDETNICPAIAAKLAESPKS